MYQFFVQPEQIQGKTVRITGSDVNHIKNVLRMKPGAIYILSGIIDDKEAVVKEAVQAAGLELLDVNYQGEWVGITARKPIV